MGGSGIDQELAELCGYDSRMSKRARRKKRPNAIAKALSGGLFRPKVEVDRRKAARLIRSAKHKAKPEDNG